MQSRVSETVGGPISGFFEAVVLRSRNIFWGVIVTPLFFVPEITSFAGIEARCPLELDDGEHVLVLYWTANIGCLDVDRRYKPGVWGLIYVECHVERIPEMTSFGDFPGNMAAL